MVSPSPASAGRVIDNAAARRFELALPGGAVAFIDYRYVGGTGPGRACVLTHAEVPASLRGQGIGARLTAATLELLRERGERVVPHCPYVAAFLHRHPQYADLLAE